MAVAAVVVVAAVGAGALEREEPAAITVTHQAVPATASTAVPAHVDVQLLSCERDHFGMVTASGTLTNPSNAPASYSVHVVFELDGIRVGESMDMVMDLEAGRSATWSAWSVPDQPGDVTCRIRSAQTL